MRLRPIGRALMGESVFCQRFFEVDEAYRIQAHVAVIGDGKRHGPAAVVHEVVVPLLEAQRAPALTALRE